MSEFAAGLAEHAEVLGRMGELEQTAAAVVDAITGCYAAGGRVYTFGNGGSAADPTGLTCIANDYEFDDVFARQVRAFVREGDVAIGFTTSGKSPNVVRALATAREQGAVTVLFGGGEGSPAAGHAVHALVVPSSSTARVQEMHVLLLHLILDRVDAWAAE
jgi:D-sedoheptulose 7-phosphate isomerase